MPQFLINSLDIINNKYIIKGEDFYHLKNVRRARPGEIIDLRSDDGISYKGKINEINGDSIIIELVKSDNESEHSLKLSLYISLLKGKKFDFALQKATEIGVSRIVPVKTERSIPDISNAENKKNRWEKIVAEAFKQCMRKDMPVVEELLPFKEAVTENRSALKIIAHPDKNGTNIKDYLAGRNKDTEISILIGPEGGFSSKELSLAKENNWDQVVFGFTSLRAETAAIVLPAVLVYELSNRSE